MKKRKLLVSIDTFAALSFVLFFANATLRTIMYGILGKNSIATAIAAFFPYFFLAIFILANPSKHLKPDFLCIYLLVLLFFGITLFFHPEYESFYAKEDYGVWDHVLHPVRGIYAYLFIRLIGDPKKIVKLLKISGWVLIPSFLNDIRTARISGYWSLVGISGATKGSYSVSFGYQVLPFALVFLFFALRDRKKSDIIGTVICIVMILVAGSRGPILFFGELLVVYYATLLKDSKEKIKIITIIVIATVLVYLFMDSFLLFVNNLLTGFGLKSRFIARTINGSLLEDNSRYEIWSAALQMINENPFGYGAMGSRHVITKYTYAGYPHNIILEFLIDYGVILGSVLLIGMVAYSIIIIFDRESEWKYAFIPLFCACGNLLISLTYWSVPTYWACLGIGANYIIENRKAKYGQQIKYSC